MDVMDEYSNEVYEMTFISSEDKPQDHIDRAHHNLKAIQRQNQRLRQEMNKIKNDPKGYIKPIRDELCSKINIMRQENDSLKRMIEKGKAPAYSQMTKKKYLKAERDQNQSFRGSIRSSIRSSLRPRNPLQEFDTNYDKTDARSTCLNYNSHSVIPDAQQQYIVGSNDEAQRAQLTGQIRFMLAKADVVDSELARISKKQKQLMKGQSKKDRETEQQLARIYDYKKRLVKLLNKLKNRQNSMNQLSRIYRQMHQQTFQRLQDAVATLEQLRQTKVRQDIDQQYAQVVELQERLHNINAQLQKMDETKWLQEIIKELSDAVRRMGIQIPKVQNAREMIDELCGILIQCHITSRRDGQNKLNMLKHYHEQQKKNNSKYIMMLKTKEQALGKKLIEMQMEK